jgi:hypothetical protein
VELELGVRFAPAFYSLRRGFNGALRLKWLAADRSGFFTMGLRGISISGKDIFELLYAKKIQFLENA